MKVQQLIDYLKEFELEKEITIVLPTGGQYHRDFYIDGRPWADRFNCVRIQISDHAESKAEAR